MRVFARSFAVVSLGLAVFAVALAQEAQEIQGAAAALKKGAEARDSKMPTNTAGRFKKELDAFSETARGLSPEAAGKKWLELYDLSQKPDSFGQVSSVIQVLPSPESWPTISNGLKSRIKNEKGPAAEAQRMLAEVLVGNAAGEWKAMDALLAQRNQGQNAAYLSSTVLAAYRVLAERTGDKARLIRGLTVELSAKPSPELKDRVVTVPDLVRLLGAPAAEKFLLTALTTSNFPLDVNQGAETRSLARRLARTNVKKLHVAQWLLADLYSPPSLYEAMVGRFGAKGQTGPAKQARFLHVFNLFRDGRRAEAVKVAQTASANGWGIYGYRSMANVVEMLTTHASTSFLGEVVGTSAGSPFWEMYVVSATRSRDMPAVVTRLQKVLAQPGIKAQDREALRTRLSTALLATDRVDEGLALLKKDMTDPAKGPADRLESAVKYANLGHLLNRPELLEEGIATAKKLSGQRGGDNDFGFSGVRQTLPDLLLDLGRGAEAEQLEIEGYARSAAEMANSYGRMPNGHLIELTRIYYRLNRPQDVRTLLDQAPDWGASDILAIPSMASLDEYTGTEPIAYIAAWSLAKTGDKESAQTILNRVMADSGGFDPAYELLLEILGPDAFIPRMDAIYAADQFEERPLIWKAIALKEQGKIAEAETTIRKAIAVDPSDGETHGGRRMRAYTVLADVLQAKGDQEASAQYRSAVTAIRTAEQADGLAAAGLLNRAIVKYEESLKSFQDAYCIQSRLAVDLMAQGREKEAEEHYRRAYELMPYSFGRVETHCLGCEHVFEGDLAQNIAEKVFSSLVKSAPEKPQVHYLLGFLRSEQGRSAEALASYRKAVQLDPDYLNAWKQMAEMAEAGNVAAAERRTISEAILRLDPLQKHGATQPIGNLGERWRQVDRALRALGSPKSSEGYRLAATVNAMKAVPGGGEDFPDPMMSYSWNSRPTSPGAAVANDALVQAIINLIEQYRASDVAVPAYR